MKVRSDWSDYLKISDMLNYPTVYNHVLKLDLYSLQWSLVDNYGDIPGVRMGNLYSIQPMGC